MGHSHFGREGWGMFLERGGRDIWGKKGVKGRGLKEGMKKGPISEGWPSSEGLGSFCM